MFRQDFTCPALLKDLTAHVAYGAITRSGPPFLTVLVLSSRPLASSAFARHYSRSLQRSARAKRHVDVLSSGY